MSRVRAYQDRTIQGFTRPSIITGIAKLVYPFGMVNTYEQRKLRKHFVSLRRYSEAVGEYLNEALEGYGN